MSEASLRIGFDSPQRRVCPHAAHGSHLAQSLLVASRRIGRQCGSLTHHVDATGSAYSRLRVLIRGLRIEVDQLPGHHEVASNNVTVGS